jgi:ABC-type polar amino acid transport system ATPase subunit
VTHPGGPEPRKTVVEVKGLRKRLGDTAAVDGVELQVSSHEVVAIMGPSGAGKSTLLRCINLLETPDSGEVTLEGRPMTRARGSELARMRARIGMVFQSFNLFPHLTALENVSLAPIHALGHETGAARSNAEGLLADVGLAEKGHAYPRHLSSGQQQRVAIARALAVDPVLMLFDEPTAALDAEMVQEVLRVIERLASGGMTMVIVSHEAGFVRAAADRVIFMDVGRFVEQAPPERFFDAPAEERSKAFVGKILR